MNANDRENALPATAQDLRAVASDNLKILISQYGITQKELADKTGVTAATMTDYCKGRRLPTAEFLVALKKGYGISIDEFLTQRITIRRSPPRETGGDGTGAALTTCQKYCGLYFVYYFDTSKLKGRDTLLPRNSLLYGILYIYEKPSFLDMPRYGSAAVLGIHDRESAAELKTGLEALEQPDAVIDRMAKEYANTAYFGEFELTHEHAFISISHADTDKALLIFHRVDNNKANYTGGIGTINSISKGRERMPVVQFIGLSRCPLSLSDEEIHHKLLLNYPTFNAEEETKDMMETIKTLYGAQGETQLPFSEYQKSVIIQSNLERYIRKSLERNMFRYGKISERDDDDWYHSIRRASVTDPEE